MEKKTIKINIFDKEKRNEELNIDSSLKIIRKEITDKINFPFIFVDQNENEIIKENESQIKLNIY